jgi:hypothetical protein
LALQVEVRPRIARADSLAVVGNRIAVVDLALAEAKESDERREARNNA